MSGVIATRTLRKPLRGTTMRGMRSFTLALILACLCSVARADQLELREGKTLEGQLLAAGPTRLLFEEASRQFRFVQRADVVGFRDGERAVALPEGDRDPSGWVVLAKGGARALRGGREVELSVSGSSDQLVLFEEDVLKTGPYGKLHFELAGGGLVHAWGDARLVLRRGIPSLQTGTMRLHQLDGRAMAQIPAGRIEVIKGKLEAVHLGERTRLRCLAGRGLVRGHVGYRLDLPRNHSVDLSPEQGDAPATLSSSNTNAWALQLQIGRRRVAIQRGERVILLGAPSAAPAEPQTPEPREEPLPPPSELARIVTAESSFALTRSGESRRVEPAEAQGMELLAEDRLQSDQGAVELAFPRMRVRLAKQSQGRVTTTRGVPFALLAGEAQVETPASASLALPGGELGLLRGTATLAKRAGELRLGVQSGTAGARLGDLVRAELLAPAELRVNELGIGEVELSVPKGAQSVPVVLGGLDVRLEAGRSVRFRGGKNLEVTALTWHPEGATRLEISGVRARIVAGPSEGHKIQLLGDGREFTLIPGTFRFYRQGKQLLVDLPKAAQQPGPTREQPPVVAKGPEPAPTNPTPRPSREPAQQPRAQVRAPAPPQAPQGVVQKRYQLSNGAVVVTRDWGELVVRPPVRSGDGRVLVAVAGPKGDVTLEPNTRILLTRLPRAARVDLPDGRYLLHEAGAKMGFTARVREDGSMRVDLSDGSRAAEVERGVEFDLSVRRDDYVLTYVFGQAVYLEPRQQMRVTQRDGLRLRLARESSSEPRAGGSSER